MCGKYENSLKEMVYDSVNSL